jgi:[ribosomal protein S18]-alanine N-acetyltransferase
MTIEIRPMSPADLDAVATLATEDPDSASAWTPTDYLAHNTLVAILDNETFAGFASARTLVPRTEHEILNVLVASNHRGKGIASKLLKTLLAAETGIWFLEVRESNTPARTLYKALGFNDFGRRNSYYQNPYEDAIVMRYCS